MTIDMKELYGFANGMNRMRIPPEDLDDVIQNAICRALEKGITDDQRVRGFVMMEMRWHGLRRIRKYRSPAVKPKNIESCNPTVVDDFQEKLEVREQIDQMMEWVDNLHHPMREVVLMVMRGLSVKEIAAVRGISQQEVYRKWYRSLEFLRLNRLT